MYILGAINVSDKFAMCKTGPNLSVVSWHAIDQVRTHFLVCVVLTIYDCYWLQVLKYVQDV